MASVVLLRAVNLAAHQRFSPAKLARDLEALDAANVGAAGTLVVRKAIPQAKLRARVLDALDFEPEIMILPGRAVAKLVAEAKPVAPGTKRYASALSTAPKKRPKLPVERPEGAKWQVRVVALQGRLAVSERRMAQPGRFYPNEVVEKALGVRATTRDWSTMEKLAKLLSARSSARGRP